MSQFVYPQPGVAKWDSLGKGEMRDWLNWILDIDANTPAGTALATTGYLCFCAVLVFGVVIWADHQNEIVQVVSRFP